MNNYSNYLTSKKCCDLRGLGPQGAPGPTGSQGPIGPYGKTGATGATGFTGDTGPALNMEAGTGSILLRNASSSETVFYNDIIQIPDNERILISGNLIPTLSNTFTLGLTGSRWQDIFIGPGSINISGPAGFASAKIGSNLSGIAYSQFGFASPFLNLGPNIDENIQLGTVGGWNIKGTGPTGENYTDLIVQLISTGGTGLTGPIYSLLKNPGPTGLQGPTGPTGSKGSTGSQGIQGFTGSQGIQGIQGSTGFTGSQGIQGSTGVQGIQGFTGSQGIQGIQGSTGVQGIQGSTGPTGVQGIQGSTGETGSTGIQGPTGSQGIQGTTGFTGSTGETGSTGVQGIQGSTGETGPQGSTGPTGVQGIQGSTGETGSTGSTGSQGIQGSTGVQGIQGPTGEQGPTGFTGSQGIQGPTGFTGSQGPTGEGINIGNTGYGNVVLYDSNTSTFYKSATIYTTAVDIVNVDGNIYPTVDNVYSLGTPTQRWKDLNIGPGTINIIGTTGQTGTIGLNNGVVYTAGGFATPYTAFSKLGLVGPSGPTGPTGTIGWKVSPTGNVYDDSFDLVAQAFITVGTGLTGLTGFVGPQYSLIKNPGPTGETGSQGLQGPTGFTGLQGLQGLQGPTGFTGLQGPTGETGSQGLQGPTGFTGSQGLQGPTGFTGLQGLQGPTGETGSQGLQGPTGSQGPTGPSNISVLGYTGLTGFTGNSIVSGGSGTYFLDSFNLGPISVTNINQQHLIYGSCQILSTTGIKNFAATIMRSPTGMSGTSLPASSVNLANRQTNSEVFYPLIFSGSQLNNLNTSLWSTSVTDNPGTQSTNGTTINIQAIDTNFGNTGNYYYAIRVNTSKSNLYYGNINMMCLKLN